MAVRLLLVALMLVSLAMSAALPRAFEDLGLWIGGAYAVQQIGRTVFMVHRTGPRHNRRDPPVSFFISSSGLAGSWVRREGSSAR
jgi:low temperature requirement protein LtrA